MIRPGIPTTFQPEITPHLPLSCTTSHLHDLNWTGLTHLPASQPVPPPVCPLSAPLPACLPAHPPHPPPHASPCMQRLTTGTPSFPLSLPPPHLPPIHYVVNSIHINCFASSFLPRRHRTFTLSQVPHFPVGLIHPQLSTYCGVLGSR